MATNSARMSLVCLAHILYHCTVSCVLTQFEQIIIMMMVVMMMMMMMNPGEVRVVRTYLPLHDHHITSSSSASNSSEATLAIS